MRVIIILFALLAYVAYYGQVNFGSAIIFPGQGEESSRHVLIILLFILYLLVEAVLTWLRARREAAQKVKEGVKPEKREVAAPVSFAAAKLEYDLKKAEDLISDLKLRLTKKEEEVSSLEKALNALRERAGEDLKPVSVLQRDEQIDAELINFLSLLQEKGRLLDFVMNDITPYSDAQVGVAARVVHQGLTSLIRQYFEVSPVHGGQEGEQVSLNGDYAKDGYTLSGRVGGSAPYCGKVVHRGWKTAKVALPRVVQSEPTASKDKIIAPAQVEVE